MKYFVTFCTTDEEVGSNPFWHTGLLLSQLDEVKNEMEVVDTWGFYSLPNSGEPTTTFVALMKKVSRLDYDIAGTHGMLLHEEYRFLDRGCGLHGVSFELTEEKFKVLQIKCETMAKDQDEAINEITDALKLQPKSAKDTKIYPHEHNSRLIFAIEKLKAAQDQRTSRLKPFELDVNIGWGGPYIPEHCNNCKSQSVSLLTGILSESQINRLTENGKHPSFPRWSGKTESIYLHTRGPLDSHKKSSGQTLYFRDGKREDVQLFWTITPQVFEALDETTEDLLRVDDDFVDELKHIASTLQKLEWFFRNSTLTQYDEQHKPLLLDYLVETYQGLCKVCLNYQPEKEANWAYGLALFSEPRNMHQKVLRTVVEEVRQFFNHLYLAAVDNWEIDDSLPMENQEQTASGTEPTEYNVIESLAGYLTPKDKKDLCSILNKTYVLEEKPRQAVNIS